jgi:hypothetical protein
MNNKFTNLPVGVNKPSSRRLVNRAIFKNFLVGLSVESKYRFDRNKLK